MSEYTPSTEEVESHWADVGFAGDRPSFNRWLARERAAAWDEGERHESEYLATWGQFCPNPENPYRVVSRG